MAKGGAATGKKRVRFLEHKAVKKYKFAEKMDRVRESGTTANAPDRPRDKEEGDESKKETKKEACKARKALRTNASKKASLVHFPDAQPFLNSAPLEALVQVVDETYEKGHAATFLKGTLETLDEAQRRSFRRALVGEMKRRCKSGVPNKLLLWLKDDCWAHEEEPLVAMAFEWLCLDGTTTLALDSREVRWREDETDVSATVTNFVLGFNAWSMQTIHIDLDDGTVLDVVMERDFAKNYRLRGTRTYKGGMPETGPADLKTKAFPLYT
ncbi:hypothetical protein M885DRAFT_541964 [Pelagophyceae sp. CCMP2097]|nr:hypothetical protein M885DRAFT_541964 [Pelagophyceae sp. CCMP2097]